MVEVYLGLGANLDDPVQHVRTALGELEALPGVKLQAASPLYRNPPLGPRDQPDYVNAVAGLVVELSPHQLLDQVQALEVRHGRNRQGVPRWGPRPLDLDILLFGQQEIADKRLQIPHPGISQRAFVYYPLWKIAPHLHIPGLGPVRHLVPGRRRPEELQVVEE